MSKIIIYNTKNEDYSSLPNNFPIYRPYPLSNPFTHDGKKSNLAKLSFKTREEAIEAYKQYFLNTYGKDNELTKEFDMVYEYYKNGNDVYLQCFCHPLPCHGNFLAQQLQKKLIQEKRLEKRKTIKKL